MRVRAERHDGGRNVEGLAAVLDQADMVEPRVVADRNDQGIVDLIGLRAVGGDIAFHQRGAGGLAEAQQRAGEHRRGRAAAGDMDDMQRLRQRGAIGDLDHDAIGHHRAVERHHRIGIVGREQLRLQRGIAGFQHLAQGADSRPFSRPPSSDSCGANTPSTSTSLRTPVDRMQLQAPPRPRQRRLIRRRRQRQHLAHQHAQIGVFPVLDPPVRQAGALISLERLLPRVGDFAAAGQPVARDGEDSLSARPVSVFAKATFIMKSDSRQAASSNCA